MIEYTHLTQSDLEFLEEETQKLISAMPILNGRPKRLNMSDIMKAHAAFLSEFSEDKSRYNGLEQMKNTIGPEVMVHSMLGFVAQYPKEEEEYFIEIKNDLAWIRSSEFPELTSDQSEALKEVEAAVDDGLSALASAVSDEAKKAAIFETLKNLNFSSIVAQTKFDHKDPRREMLSEMAMLGTFFMLYSEDVYNAMKRSASKRSEPDAPKLGL